MSPQPIQPQGDPPRLPGVTTTVRRVKPTRRQLVERVRALEAELARLRADHEDLWNERMRLRDALFIIALAEGKPWTGAERNALAQALEPIGSERDAARAARPEGADA